VKLWDCPHAFAVVAPYEHWGSRRETTELTVMGQRSMPTDSPHLELVRLIEHTVCNIFLENHRSGDCNFLHATLDLPRRKIYVTITSVGTVYFAYRQFPLMFSDSCINRKWINIFYSTQPRSK